MAAIEHLKALAEDIGPRGSTTPQEEAAARYAADVLRQAGLAPTTESFRSARSAWYPYVLFTGLALIGAVLFWVGGRWGAVAGLAVNLLAILSVLLELAFRPNPIRWVLPKGTSQNVWVRVPPRDKERGQVVLMGHLDSHRTPLVFSTDRWLALFHTLVPVGLISALLLVGLMVAGSLSEIVLWRLVSLPLAAIMLALFVLTLQADRTPYSPGANDNASGAGIVLDIARQLAAEPLAHTAVWVVLSGCEEVGCYGADAFARAHRQELRDAAWIPLDGMASAGGAPMYLTRETFLLSSKADPALIALAERVAARLPELGVRGYAFSGAYTEGAIGVKHGFRVLALMSTSPNGSLAEWHRPTDVVANVDRDVLERSRTFTWELLQEIDR